MSEKLPKLADLNITDRDYILTFADEPNYYDSYLKTKEGLAGGAKNIEIARLIHKDLDVPLSTALQRVVNYKAGRKPRSAISLGDNFDEGFFPIQAESRLLLIMLLYEATSWNGSSTEKSASSCMGNTAKSSRLTISNEHQDKTLSKILTELQCFNSETNTQNRSGTESTYMGYKSAFGRVLNLLGYPEDRVSESDVLPSRYLFNSLGALNKLSQPQERLLAFSLLSNYITSLRYFRGRIKGKMLYINLHSFKTEELAVEEAQLVKQVASIVQPTSDVEIKELMKHKDYDTYYSRLVWRDEGDITVESIQSDYEEVVDHAIREYREAISKM